MKIGLTILILLIVSAAQAEVSTVLFPGVKIEEKDLSKNAIYVAKPDACIFTAPDPILEPTETKGTLTYKLNSSKGVGWILVYDDNKMIRVAKEVKDKNAVTLTPWTIEEFVSEKAMNDRVKVLGLNPLVDTGVVAEPVGEVEK